MNKQRISSARIIQLAPNEIFVFGSNLQGQSYAIPTMQGGVETIKPFVDDFLQFSFEHGELDFLVTEIGCGIAGFSPLEIAPLFFPAIDENMWNVYLPGSFYEVYERW